MNNALCFNLSPVFTFIMQRNFLQINHQAIYSDAVDSKPGQQPDKYSSEGHFIIL